MNNCCKIENEMIKITNTVLECKIEIYIFIYIYKGLSCNIVLRVNVDVIHQLLIRELHIENVWCLTNEEQVIKLKLIDFNFKFRMHWNFF